ncbi:MAG: PDZ domain-containing protein [Sedimentisphaerales bacterium]|nr:PDZ domain-containing protein [Sedimentisphaerales bacterium]
MKLKTNIVAICIALLALGGWAYGQDARPYIGVQLDPSPLPELLTKHLGLKPEQGVRIRNVSVGSPADELGLERDDIIIRFQDENVTNVDELVNAIQSEKVGATVSLEIIHLGQRQTLEVQLKAMAENPKWKYPAEPEIVTSWRPGRFFRIGPNSENWMEVPFERMPDVNREVRRFFQERYTTHHATDGEEYTITIEGSPTDEDTRIIVESGGAEYATTVGKLEALPEKYRAAAQEALESARQSSKQRLRLPAPALPEPPNPDVYRRYFENLTIPRPDFNQWTERQNRMLERLQEQMERLQERMEQMERRYRQRSGDRPAGPDEPDGSGAPAGNIESPAPTAGQTV